MTPTEHLDRNTEFKLMKLAARTVLASGLGVAVMMLAAVTATADPAPPNPTGPNPTAAQHPHSESGLCNQDSAPRGAPAPPPGYCG
jgi:hypothetical protein